MGKVYNCVDDFNNVSVKVVISGIELNSIIRVYDNGNVLLSVDVTNDIVLWDTANQKFNLLIGKTVFNNIPISFVNCLLEDKSTNVGLDGNNIYYLNFLVGYIFLGISIKSINSNDFDKADVKFDNIDYLTDDFPYSYDGIQKKYISNPTLYSINCSDYIIDVNFSFDNKNSRRGLNLERNTFVEFSLDNKLSFENLLNEIYKFNYFLMIIMRKHITISNLNFYKGNIKGKLFFCFKDDPYNENYINYAFLDINRLKIEKINNLNTIYNNYLNCFKKLNPVLEIYYGVICNPISDLNRYIVGTTALEYFSNEFYLDEVKEQSKMMKHGKVIYIDNVYILIKNANIVFSFSHDEIDLLSRNIVDSRAYYIHYKKNRKILSRVELFSYSQFLIDILIINIGLILEIDEKYIKQLSNYGKYYTKDKLLLKNK